jgi:hypothetical protein
MQLLTAMIASTTVACAKPGSYSLDPWWLSPYRGRRSEFVSQGLLFVEPEVFPFEGRLFE